MMRILPICLLLLIAGIAEAGSGITFGESSRAAALGGAVTARTGGLSSITFNPAGLADIEVSTLGFTTQFGLLDLWFSRTGEEREAMDRSISGFALAIGSRLPGPKWVQRFRLGFSLYLPAEYALRIQAPVRRDNPYFPLYGDRLEHAAATGAVAVDLDMVSLGFGLTLTPDLDGPTEVTYVPGLGDTVDENVVIDIERELKVRAAFSAGIVVQPIDELSFGLAWHDQQVVRAIGQLITLAGPVVLDDELDFLEFWSPQQVAAGVAVYPSTDLSLSVDAVLEMWSGFQTIHNEEPEPPFEDTITIRGGAAWVATPGIELRAGYGFQPTPIPAQNGDTNLLDADRHEIALGIGFDLRELAFGGSMIDLHLRTQLLATQRGTKVVDTLTDADDGEPGQQIDNLGFPGFEAGGEVWQFGITFTLFFGDDDNESE
jgi:hypothetical protein